MSTSRAPAWLVIWVGVSAAMHVGKLPPTLPLLREQLGMSLLQAGFLLSMVQTAGMLMGVLVGLGADRLGLRRCMLLGVWLLSLSSLVGGLVTEVVGMLLLRALEGLGFLMVTMPAPALIRRLVEPSALQRMMGYWGAYMPLGTALALLLAPWVIGFSGWPVLWWGLGLWLWLSGVMVWCWVPADDATAALGATVNPWRQRLARVLTHRGPWLVVLLFAVYSAQWLAIIGFLPSVYAQMGLNMTMGGALTAVVALANMAGNVLSGRLLGRGITSPALLRFGVGAMGVGALLAFAQWQAWHVPAALQFLCVVCFSAMGGVIPGTLFSLAVRLAPSDDTVAATVGWMQQWSSIGQFAGPPLVAWMAAATGGWQWTWVVTGSCCVMGWWLAGQVRALLTPKGSA
jgi:CP family cyanate transporter-like MFS transporter